MALRTPRSISSSLTHAPVHAIPTISVTEHKESERKKPAYLAPLDSFNLESGRKASIWYEDDDSSRLQDEVVVEDDDGDEADDEGVIHRRHGGASVTSGTSHRHAHSHSHSHSSSLSRDLLLASRTRTSAGAGVGAAAPLSVAPVQAHLRSPNSQNNVNATLSPNPYLNYSPLTGTHRPARSPLSPLRFSFTAESLDLTRARSFGAQSYNHDSSDPSPSSSSALPEDKKGLDKDRFDGLLRTSMQRRASGSGIRVAVDAIASGSGSSGSPNTSPVSPAGAGAANEFASPMLSGRKSMDLRKEITLKAHAAKQAEERRQVYLQRYLEGPSSSPATICSPVTPPLSPAEFHYTLPSPGLVSPLAAFEQLSLSSAMSSPGSTPFERVERVDWSKELRGVSGSVSEVEDTDQEVVALGSNGRMPSVNLFPPPLPIGTGRRIPTTAPLSLEKRNEERSASSLKLAGALLPQTAAASTGLNVVIPPRRSASLRPIHSHLTHSSAPSGTPSASLARTRALTPLMIPNAIDLHRPRPRPTVLIPSLQDITARYSSSQKSGITGGVQKISSASSGSTLTSTSTSSSSGSGSFPPVSGTGAGAQARAGRLPGFLRDTVPVGSRSGAQPTIALSPVPVGIQAPRPLHSQPQPQIISALPTGTETDMIIPPPRPKSADSASDSMPSGLAVVRPRPQAQAQTLQEERSQRRNAMMATLNHRRRRSDPISEEAFVAAATF